MSTINHGVKLTNYQKKNNYERKSGVKLTNYQKKNNYERKFSY